MTRESRSGALPKRLPRHFWPLALVGVFVVMLVTLIVFAALGWNPYIGASVGGGIGTLVEVAGLKRRGF